MLAALAPLASRIKRLTISGSPVTLPLHEPAAEDDSDSEEDSGDRVPLVMGSTQVRALGRALGSSLRSLTLSNCRITRRFWTSLWHALPQLGELQLGFGLQGAVNATTLACFCARAPRRLALRLPDGEDEEWWVEVMEEVQKALQPYDNIMVEID
uniref:Uncharacterized protein n=1 Tax=Chlamydomonas leiostraca TaxID=1034604 RepID=A0A7S0R814_9CHLO